MNYHKITKASVVNGLGFRTVLWVAGCPHHCPGCHNPETWDIKSGKLFDQKAKEDLFDALSKPYIKGITLSGGDPLHKDNCYDILHLIEEIKEKFPNKDIVLYTGYTINEIYEGISVRQQIVELCDIVIDGQYIEAQRDITLPFRGSSNQHILKNKGQGKWE